MHDAVPGPQQEGSGVVGRLAPSPTGLLHLGHARSFLLAWWSARSRGGEVRMRLEDLDTARVRPEFTERVLTDLEWLGLDWDGEILVQSQHLEAYEQAGRLLLERALAFPCTCTRAEVRAASAPHAEDAPEGHSARYPGTCRGRFANEAAARSSGRPTGLRLRVEPGPVTVEDGLAGRREFDVSREVGDFLVRRRDGVHAYQLAVVVDDARQGVSEVLRGHDLLSSAARQQLLYQALGLRMPRWVHVPLVCGPDGQRLAKRHGDALTLSALRESGVDPRAVVGWAASSSGQTSPERLTAREVLEVFDLGRVPSEEVRLSAEQARRLTGARS